jgi:hypothetical protein
MIYPRFGSLYLIKIMAVLSLMSCSVKAQPQGEMTVPIRSDPLAIVSTQSISFARVSTANSRLSHAADERISAAASSKAKPESAAKGSLLLCGGSVIPDKILRQFHDFGRGSMGRLVIIPTASRLADQKGETDLWTKLWTAYPWQSIQLVHAATRSEAEEPAFADRIKYATAVWIAGGDQQRLRTQTIDCARRHCRRYQCGCSHHVQRHDLGRGQSAQAGNWLGIAARTDY